jgi:hypothetical protein
MSAPTEALGLVPNCNRRPRERFDIRPHGTEAHAQRHRRRGEKPCPACLAAENAANAWRRALRAGSGQAASVPPETEGITIMGLFRSADERATAGAAKTLLDKMPARVRREVLRGLSADDAETVGKAVKAIEQEQAARRAAEEHVALDRSGWWSSPGGR